MPNFKGFNPANGEWNDSLTGDFMWINTNIGEALSIVMTPFTSSVICSFYDELNVLPGYATAGNIGGRAYQNGTVMYSALKAIGKKPEELSQEMSLGDANEFAKLRLPTLNLPRTTIFYILRNGVRIWAKEKAALRKLPKFLHENPAWFAAMRQQVEKAKKNEELIQLWDEILAYSLQCFWMMVSTAWEYAGLVVGLRRQLAPDMSTEDINALLNIAHTEPEQLASLGPVLGLAKVARGELDRQAYLERYGHRGPYETEFAAPRPAEDPTWLDQQLAALTESTADVRAMLAIQHAAFDDAWERYRRRRLDRAEEMRQQLDHAAETVRVREAVRSESIRTAWAGRLWALRAAELSGLGNDLFFLIYPEVLDLLQGKGAPTETISTRRETYTRYRELPPFPPIIIGFFDPFQWSADPERRNDVFDSLAAPPSRVSEADDSKIIHGIPASQGQVEGIVRRLENPEQGTQLQPGEILVTAQTNIGWTLIFPRAAAVITDVGAQLSHAAIIARELGIPAVVGCKDATARLHTGDRVRVDGAQGTVEVLS
jgi:pyruvate,water dikinase